MSMRLYVGNLSYQTSSAELEQMFGQAGSVLSAVLISDRETGRSRGFGFVEMASREEGERAILQFNGRQMSGRTLTVNEARPKENGNGNPGNRPPMRRASRWE